LKLWIQKSPTDSARRYQSPNHAKCRFKDCPAQLYQTGTIIHGHYRVAFDERWHAHGKNVDPFHVAGFAHLYCMERFLDFEAVCKLGIVEVDKRSMPHEPRARFAGTLHGQPEYGIASAFVDACMADDLRTVMEKFQNYPVHSQFDPGEQKPHKDTLTYWMHLHKQQTRSQAQLLQFEKRGLKESHLLVNKGDLEVLFMNNPKRLKMVKKAEKKAAKTATKGKKHKADHLDEVPPVVPRVNGESLIQEALQETAKKIAAGSQKHRRTDEPSKQVFVSSDDDSESGFNSDDDDSDDGHVSQTSQRASRQSPRLKDKARQNYAVSPGVPESLRPTKRVRLESPEQLKSLADMLSPSQNSLQTNHGPIALPTGDDQLSPDFTWAPYEWDKNDPDLADVLYMMPRRSSASSRRTSGGSSKQGQALERRPSSHYAGITRRGSSVMRVGSLLNSESSSRRNTRSSRKDSGESDRHVAFGGVNTHVFDGAASPQENLRRSTRGSAK
jgi:hypothetical protein